MKNARTNWRARAATIALTCGPALAWLGAAPAGATDIPPLSDETLTRTASVVLTGTVLDVQSFWTPPGPDGPTIYTNVKISAENVLKGYVPSQTFTLRLLGGTVGTTTMTVVDMPRFETGEQVLLFLGRNMQSPTPTVGLHRGKLTIAKDEGTGRDFVVERGRFLDGYLADVQGVIDAEIAQAAADSGLRPQDIPVMRTIIRPEDIPARPERPSVKPVDENPDGDAGNEGGAQPPQEGGRP